MGKTTRWLKGLFSVGGGGGGGGKKSLTRTSNKPNNEVSGNGGLVERSGALFGSFSSGGRGGGCVGGVEEESNRAIAMAAATAAVAEAAVAAAQAAAVVVRLTSSSGRVCRQVVSGRIYEDWAAVRIQAVFRGYLARRALKALKGLVKLQALVRGHIVRKQTLRCMQALVRVQARARAYRILADNYIYQTVGGSCVHHPQGCSTCTRNKHVGRENKDCMREMPATLSKKASGANNACSEHSNLNWLDNWMEQRYSDTSHTMQLRAQTSTMDDEKNAKILEMDTGKTILNSKRRNMHLSMSSDHNSRSLMTMADSPSKDSTIAQGSIPSLSFDEMQHRTLSPLRFQYETVESSESSQQLYSASSRHASSKCGPFTPLKSDCSRSFLSGYSGYPNYMAYTESSKAKARSQSAPKQRPTELEKLCNMKRVQQTLGSGCSGASACCQSSTSSHGFSVKFHGKAHHSSGRLDRMGVPVRR